MLAGCQAPAPSDGPAAAGAPVGLFAPRFVAGGRATRRVDSVCLDTAALDGHEAIDARAAQILARLGVRLADAGGCAWRVEVVTDPPPLAGAEQAAWLAASARDERFALVSDAAARPAHTALYAGSPRAVLFALRELVTRTAADGSGRAQAATETVVDAPDFPVRGVVEGFYGPPYGDAERQTLLHLMGELRQNIFLYAPQNDDFDHIHWYTPYPVDRLQALASAVEAARREQIDFVWAVRPGLGLYYKTDHPIQYSSDSDFALLVAKIDQLRGIGVRHFGLFFDDNLSGFTNDADRAAFPSLGAAHAALVDRVEDYVKGLDPAARVIMVGTDYSAAAAGWQAYNEDLRAALHPSIDVFWTGNQTYSATIAAADLYPVADSLGRTPLVWDNWPAKGGAVPLDGRAADVPEAAAGFVANPVLSSWQRHPIADAELVLGTDASYAWHADLYQPDAAWAAWSGLMSITLAELATEP